MHHCESLTLSFAVVEGWAASDSENRALLVLVGIQLHQINSESELTYAAVHCLTIGKTSHVGCRLQGPT